MKYRFLQSALSLSNPFLTTDNIVEWVKEQNSKVSVVVEQVPFKNLENWNFHEKRNILQHSSGQFFSIEGLRVNTNWGEKEFWEQPIINQPEIGYLGIITKEINGVLYFLLQAKIEPGNINHVQLSPTLQATRSNYTQAHKGKKPLYLEYFQQVKSDHVLLDQLQSEQGARFLKKRNRNIIIEVKEDIPLYDNFIWVTLGQIKALLSHSNLINMDTRTVISGIPLDFKVDELANFVSESEKSKLLQNSMFLSCCDNAIPMYPLNQILNWFTSLKFKYCLKMTSGLPLNSLKDWVLTDREIHHCENKYFKVIGARVEISNREVTSWCQPLVQPMQEGLIALITKKVNGVSHFLVQAKLESGNFDVMELAPTVQCMTDSYSKGSSLPYLDYILNASKDMILYDSLQSEEGGRFFRDENRNVIVQADENFSIDTPENYTWMTLAQLNLFIKFNNYLNIQIRGLLSTISFN